jgi:hypothetical protein
MITSWALVMFTLIHYPTGLPLPLWETLDVVETQRDCFNALERRSLADAHPPVHQDQQHNRIEHFYRCNAIRQNSDGGGPARVDEG